MSSAEMGLEDVEIAVEVEIADPDSHAGLLHAVFVESRAPRSSASSRNVPSWLLRKKKLGVESQATKMSGQPSLSKSAATAVIAIAAARFGDSRCFADVA